MKEMKTKTLSKQFCQYDVVFGLLNERLHLEPIKVAVGTAILTFAVLWTELFLAGMSFSQSISIVSFQALVIFPLAIILYFAVPEFLATPFTFLEKSDSIGESIDPRVESYSSFREKMISSVSSFLWIGLALLMIGYYWYYRLFTNVPSDPSRLLPDEIRVWVRLVLLLIYSPLCFIGSCRDTPHIWGHYSPKCVFCTHAWKNHGDSQRASPFIYGCTHFGPYTGWAGLHWSFFSLVQDSSQSPESRWYRWN
jgi:hypothetical protein